MVHELFAPTVGSTPAYGEETLDGVSKHLCVRTTPARGEEISSLIFAMAAAAVHPRTRGTSSGSTSARHRTSGFGPFALAGRKPHQHR
jgi:hypothetical protein